MKQLDAFEKVEEVLRGHRSYDMDWEMNGVDTW